MELAPVDLCHLVEGLLGRLRLADGRRQVVVEDDGPGIAPERRLLALRPFHRGRDDGEGSGLGLAIVDGIARTHRARLTLDAGAEGGGLRVELRFAEPSP